MSERSRVIGNRAPALLVAAMLSVGCSRSVGGMPVAMPGQAGVDGSAAVLATTCGDYLNISGADRLAVITAIADSGNRLVALNPNAWVDLAVALCSFVNPGAPVKDILRGAAR